MKKSVRSLQRPSDSKNDRWKDALSEAYFPLDVECRHADTFNGDLETWSLGVIDVSKINCDGVLYRRQKHHLLNERDSSLLITIPHDSEVHFNQMQRQTCCTPGSFLIERGDAPYEFWHKKRTSLWVVKVATESVRSRIGSTKRLGALTFDATSGVASYFIDAVRNAVTHLDDIDDVARNAAGQHILEMLCLSIRRDERILDSNLSSVRAGHLQRAEQFIRDNLNNPDLCSNMVAENCRISLRYLQRLFAENDQSIVGFIREKRLNRCDEELRSGSDRTTVAEIAYKWGFCDQAQFSKHYKNKFGCTPTDRRKMSREQQGDDG